MARKKIAFKLALLVSSIVCTLLNTMDVHARTSPTSPATQSETSEFSCIYPASYEERVMCRNIGDQILAVTIRIEMHADYAFGQSHATVVGGRYLVTHNHFSYSLTEIAAGDGEGYTGVSLRTANGTLLIENAPLSTYTVVHQDAETLVLDFGIGIGKGKLAAMGLASAKVTNWTMVKWNAGMEIAHIDWNGETAHVDWTLVEVVATDGGTAHIQVNNYAMKGASGGGAYWNGQHVGNIWARNLEKDANTGEVTRLYTLIALNAINVGELD